MIRTDTRCSRRAPTATEVRKLQARLTELGYYAGGVDGVYGEATEDAVKAFQRQNNLSGDGQAGEATQSKLYSDSAKENSRPVTTANPNETRSLSIGMEGNDVYSVQEYLIKLGYLTGVADGVYGAETEDAVILFQQRNGLEDDGVVGSATLRKLSSSSAKKGPLASATATPEPGEYVTLREGDSGTLVYDLQERLYELAIMKAASTAASARARRRRWSTSSGRTAWTTTGSPGARRRICSFPPMQSSTPT